MKQFLESDLRKGVNRLNSMGGTVQEYVQSTTPMTSSDSSTGFEKIVDAMFGAPLGLLEALSGILSPVTPHAMPATTAEPRNPYWLPSDFPKPHGGGEWAFVALEDIDLSESHVQGPEDFKKVPLEEMERGWQVFYSDVLPAVQKGATADDFSSLDESLGLTPANGFRRVFDAFLGNKQWNEPIRVEKKGDRYSVVNGFHRIFVAGKLGLSEVICALK